MREYGVNPECLDGKLVTGINTQIAYISNITYKISAAGSPFLRVLFIDVNGLPVIGRYFNMTDAKKKEWVYAEALGHLARVYYEADEWNGERYLNVKEVTQLAPEEEETFFKQGLFKLSVRDRDLSRQLFREEFDKVLQDMHTRYAALDILGIENSLVSKADEDIFGGVIGGYLNHIAAVLSIVHSGKARWDICNVGDIHCALIAYVITMHAWAEISNSVLPTSQRTMMAVKAMELCRKYTKCLQDAGISQDDERTVVLKLNCFIEHIYAEPNVKDMAVEYIWAVHLMLSKQKSIERMLKAVPSGAVTYINGEMYMK